MTLRTRLLSFVLILSVSATSFAQSAPPAPSDKIMKELNARGTGKHIKVTELDGTELKGTLVSIDTTGFQLTVDKAPAPTRIEYAQVKKVGSTGLSTAAKIGIGVLIGIAVVIIFIVASLKASGF